MIINLVLVASNWILDLKQIPALEILMLKWILIITSIPNIGVEIWDELHPITEYANTNQRT